MRVGNILVTGGSGYIGGRLVERLCNLKWDVVATSRSTGGRQGCDSATVEAPTVALDLTARNDVEQLIKRVRPTVIYHFGGVSYAAQQLETMGTTFDANCLGTVNVLGAAVRYGCAQVIYCGSIEEPLEDWRMATSPYAVSKLVGSMYAILCHRLYEIGVVIIRPSFVYGPGFQKESKLIPHVITRFLENRFPDLSSGLRKMDWVYIDDIVEAFVRVLNNDAAIGREIAVGSGTLTSIRDVVTKIACIMGREGDLLFGSHPDRISETSRATDLSVCREVLDWVPSVEIDTGLKRTVEWYKSTFSGCEDPVP